jgi:tRNA (cmo5U34)-methyltransferase
MTTPSPYRWNSTAFAEGYDRAAEVIHPRYLEIQDAILSLLPSSLQEVGLVIDLGGGSGRLVERILDRWPAATAVVIDQSEPFLALAERRLARFGDRARCVQKRLQEDWPTQLSQPAAAIVTMSAIHHLEPAEKQKLYRQCFAALAPGGVLLNGDEICDPDPGVYRQNLSTWAEQMRSRLASGEIPAVFRSAAESWIDRNVTRFGEPKHSGDDCHETIAVQLDYFRRAGFATADSPWQYSLWAILRGQRAK